MTLKEKQLIKKLGYIHFAIYTFIKHNPHTKNKDIQIELGVSQRGSFRAIKELILTNVITSNDKYSIEYNVNCEKDWLV